VGQRYAALGFTDAVWDLYGLGPGTQSAFSPATGVLYGTMLGVLNGDVITNVWTYVTTAGAGTTPTHIYMGVYSTTGTQLAVSADLASNSGWDSTGVKGFPLGSAYTVPSNEAVYLCLIQVGAWGTTAMKVQEGASYGALTTAIGTNPYFCVKQTGQSGAPAPATFASDNANIWFGWN
jgi:hypothetical protein